MPIDAGKVVGARLPDVKTSWDETNVILYHLGVGAGDPPTSETELSYCFEPNLKVLPSFATIPPFEAMAHVAGLDGMDINPMLLLHGEHEVEIHRPLPVAAKVESISHVTGVYDKGKAALIVVESVSSDENGPLFTNRASLFARGEGGLSSQSPDRRRAGGPAPASDPAPARAADLPSRAADLVVEARTIPQQALLYRLSGDRNPLHADPAFAAIGGFDRPILHGLCSFGIACKAVVDHALEGHSSLVASYRARFAGVVFPGETLVISIWREADLFHIEATTKERSLPVLTNASVRVRV
ncbi:MAG: MaoC/PaaZ C-terminal domain-containing protein [Acidimicrobiia bacterium]